MKSGGRQKWKKLERLLSSRDIDWDIAYDRIPDSPFAEERTNENWGGQYI